MPKILIVEDDPNVVSFLTTILLGAGYTCLVATSTAKARSLLTTERGISLVLLDQNLGEDSDTGLALLTDLRQEQKFQNIPVIICTGDTRTAIVSGFLGQRIASFLKKPFRPERLLADVDRALGHVGNAILPPPPLVT
jgi:DNA-binding response OmpR family regulator